MREKRKTEERQTDRQTACLPARQTDRPTETGNCSTSSKLARFMYTQLIYVPGTDNGKGTGETERERKRRTDKQTACQPTKQTDKQRGGGGGGEGGGL